MKWIKKELKLEELSDLLKEMPNKNELRVFSNLQFGSQNGVGMDIRRVGDDSYEARVAGVPLIGCDLERLMKALEVLGFTSYYTKED